MLRLPGRILAAVRSRLPAPVRPIGWVRDAGDRIGELAAAARWGAGRIATGAVAATSGAWGSLAPGSRRRLLAGLGAGLAAAALLGVAVPNLPCEAPAGERCPPADDAAPLVPADALAYVHVVVDRDDEQYEAAREIAAELPLLGGQAVDRALALLPGSAGEPGAAAEIEPLLGGELALAVLGGRAGGRQTVGLLEAGDPGTARELATRLGLEADEIDAYRGVELRIGPRGMASATVGGFLVVGPRAGVRDVVATATGAPGAEPLDGDDDVARARDLLPDHRLADAYLSPEGVDELVAGDPGVLGSLGALAAPGATEGVALALAAADGELELAVRSVLDPERARQAPGFFAALTPFEPRLPERLGEPTLAYLGFGEPGRTVGALLAQADALAPGVAAGFEDLAATLRRTGELDLERDLLPALGDEAALVLAARPEDPDRAAAPAGAAALPYLALVADEVDEPRARAALARLQVPIAAEVDPSRSFAAPGFEQREIAGVEAYGIRLTPAVELTHAVFDGLAAIATAPAGIEALAAGEGGLDDSERYRRATEDFEGPASLAGYFDLSRLVGVAEVLGLAEDPAYPAFAPELRRLGTLGLQVRAEPELLATDLRLVPDL